MNKEDTKHDKSYSLNEDHVATTKDLRIMGLELRMELEGKINAVTFKLGSLIIACSGVLFGLLSYFHK
jgi:hypothetical protein